MRNRGLQGTARALSPFEGVLEEEMLRTMRGVQKKMWMKMRWMRMRARRWSRGWAKVRRGLMEGAWGKWD